MRITHCTNLYIFSLFIFILIFIFIPANFGFCVSWVWYLISKVSLADDISEDGPAVGPSIGGATIGDVSWVSGFLLPWFFFFPATCIIFFVVSILES